MKSTVYQINKVIIKSINLSIKAILFGLLFTLLLLRWIGFLLDYLQSRVK